MVQHFLAYYENIESFTNIQKVIQEWLINAWILLTLILMNNERFLVKKRCKENVFSCWAVVIRFFEVWGKKPGYEFLYCLFRIENISIVGTPSCFTSFTPTDIVRIIKRVLFWKKIKLIELKLLLYENQCYWFIF